MMHFGDIEQRAPIHHLNPHFTSPASRFPTRATHQHYHRILLSCPSETNGLAVRTEIQDEQSPSAPTDAWPPSWRLELAQEADNHLHLPSLPLPSIPFPSPPFLPFPQHTLWRVPTSHSPWAPLERGYYPRSKDAMRVAFRLHSLQWKCDPAGPKNNARVLQQTLRLWAGYSRPRV